LAGQQALQVSGLDLIRFRRSEGVIDAAKFEAELTA
jgi:hypothetical protein